MICLNHLALSFEGFFTDSSVRMTVTDLHICISTHRELLSSLSDVGSFLCADICSKLYLL